MGDDMNNGIHCLGCKSASVGARLLGLSDKAFPNELVRRGHADEPGAGWLKRVQTESRSAWANRFHCKGIG